MVTFPNDFETRTGFALVRTEIQSLAVAPSAQKEIADASFSTDYHAIEQNLNLLRELKDYLLFHAISEEYFVDLADALFTLSQHNRNLQEEELSALRTALLSVQYFQTLFSEEHEKYLWALINAVELPQEALREIDAVLDRTGHIKDNASPLLYQLRTQLRSRENAIARKMAELLTRCQKEGYSDANAQLVVRDGRLVLPIAAQHKKKIPSLQLDRSATGQTLFVTPYEVLELENEIADLEQREREEVALILAQITELLRPFLISFSDCARLLQTLDVLRAKALYALQIGGSAPILTHECRLLLRDAQHPLLLKRMKKAGTEPIPLYLTLDTNSRILVISGPNAGGKSVALQTVALAVYMLQCGFLPLVKENSEMGLFTNLMLDIGDAQSIENDLSTYSSHLKAMSFFAKHASPQSLFLIDEMGSGTEPTAGGAMAEAILEDLYQKGAYGIVTTHYATIKNLATRTEGMQNAAMRYHLEALQPLYILDIGAPGSSYAFEIAKKMGVPSEWIRRAEELVGTEYITLEEQLRLVAQERKTWELKQQALDIQQAEIDRLQTELAQKQTTWEQKRQQILADARRKAQDMLRDCNRTIEETVRLIKETHADKETTKRLRNELKFYQEFVEEELKQEVHTHKKETKPTPELAVGDPVKLLDGTTTGQVVNVKGNKVVVAVGQVMTTLQISEVTPMPKNTSVKNTFASNPSRTVTPQSSMRQRRLNFSPNIDIRGMRGEEAMDLVHQFLDDAQMFGIPFVSILHGKGTGILRNLLHDYLRHATFVESFTNSSPTCSDGGITEVYLK